MYLRDRLPEQEARTFSADLRGLIEWLSIQDPSTRYNWDDPKKCVMCRFYQAMGFEAPWSHPQTRYEKPFQTLTDYHVFGRTWPWTYGAALERARALLAKSQD